MSISKQRLLRLSSSALRLLCCAGVAPSQTPLKCHTLQGNEFRGVDKNRRGFFHRSCSGAPVALIGQKGIRCDWPSRWPIKSGAAPATVGGESFFKLPLGCQSLGRRRRVVTREPGDLPEQSSFRRAGRAHGAVFRCGDRGELSSGTGRPPCLRFCRFLRATNPLACATGSSAFASRSRWLSPSGSRRHSPPRRRPMRPCPRPDCR